MDKNEGIELLVAKIKADINFYNYMNQEFPITMDELIEYLRYTLIPKK